jgi:predicted ATPase/signal transduction histidine kinase/tRNA A-37 threonylcarbamoyl transferase component Bud32
VYEATRKRDGRRVVAKIFELGDEGVEARVEHEFRLLQELDIDGVVRAVGLEHAGEQLVLLLDYVPGHNLAEQLAGQPMPVPAFLRAARRLCSILAQVHARRVVHRDIKPSNILVDERGELYLADFGISVLLESERRYLYDARMLTGTLPYISPEQTGRTSREVDYRSDLYSLGATFYEMLTGRRPFDAIEPLALIHAQLARTPEPPDRVVASIPPLLSAIVLKLLRKAPEHRYQSVRGLEADLDALAEALAAGETDPQLELGRHDHAASLQLPASLYGRARERGLLEAELARVVEQGSQRLVVIAGDPGLGKSALLRELEAGVAARGGYLAGGRFEPHASEPGQAIVRAFTSLLEQILTESDERLAQWAKRLRQALGALAPVVAMMVPELRLVLGELPPVAPLELTESRNRLHLALARFTAVFASDGPLVLAFDDLQWADPSSLELLGALLRAGDARVLLVATSLAQPTDAIASFQANLARELGERIRQIDLHPLTDADVRTLLADMFGARAAQLDALAQLVSAKTANNPLFIRQFLVHLADLELLRATRDGWVWQIDELRAAKIPDDVLAVMTAKLERLAVREREVLERAACIGTRFEFGALEAITTLSRDALAASLHALVEHGLIMAVADDYEFCHDRVAAMARAALADDVRRGLRWALGRELLRRARASGPTLGEQVFEIVEALIEGQPSAVLLRADERDELATLEVEAGERALAAAGWDAALRYFEQASALLRPQLDAAKRGQGPRALLFAAEFGRAQAIALAGDADAAARAFADLLEWDLSLAEHSLVVARQLRILTVQQHMQRAVELARTELDRCGLRLPDKPGMAWMVWQILTAARVAKRASTAGLLAAPAIADERVVACIELLSVLKHAALVVDLNLFAGITGLHAKLVLAHGYHPTGAEALSQLAISLAAIGRPEQARALCASAETLARERAGNAASLVRTLAATRLFAGPSLQRFGVCAETCESNAARALELGERETAGYFGALGVGLHLVAGTHLREILELAPRLRRELPDWGTHEMAVIADMNIRFAEALSKRGASEPAFVSREQFASLVISKLTQYVAVVVDFGGRLLFALAAGRPGPESLDELTRLTAPIVADFATVMFGVWQVPRFAMKHCVLVVERLEHGLIPRRTALGLLRRHTRLVGKWAASCPDNYAAMHELCRAEQQRARGRPERAMAHYERARELAFDHGVAVIEALACLRIAGLAERVGWTVVGHGGVSQARRAFERWGAWALVERIDARDPLAAAPRSNDDPAPDSDVSRRLFGTGSAGTTMTLDMATVLGTLQAISEDLQIEQVITRVLAAAIENAGADRGVLVLDNDGRLEFAAEGDGAGCQQFLAAPLTIDAARERLPVSVVNFVLRTRNPLIIDDLGEDSRFSADPYVHRTGVRSLLCLPISKQTERIGVLLLENRLVGGAFTLQRLELLKLLLAQAASALDNARLYAALARSEALWRSLVDGAPDVIALLDERGTLEFINHLGPHTPTQPHWRGQALANFMDESSSRAWQQAIDDVQTHAQTRELELALAPPDADATIERRTYAVRLTPIAVAGELRKLLAIATDITDRRVFEARQRQQQRLESIGTLASGVAHEINNPVQGILNYAELLDSNPDDPQSVREFAAEITHETERVASIVRNLLAFARQEQDRQYELVAPARIVESTLSLLRAVIRKDHVQLDIDVPDTLPQLRCRSQQVQQILMNLVSNARDALNDRYPRYDPDKRISLRASTFERDGASWIRFAVRDHAGGIPEAVRQQIFDPFFTTKGRDKGTGLGLSVSFGIAVEHGGDLSFETETGVGTVFHLDLPVAGPTGETNPIAASA